MFRPAGGGVLAGLLALLTGCAGDTAERADPGPSFGFIVPPSSPGDLLLVEGDLHFRPCGAEGAVRVRDGTGSEARSIVEDLGYGEDRVRAAVVLDGDRLLEIRHATPEGPPCEDLLPDAQAEARGNEPFWALRIVGEDARWITPEDPAGVAYSGGTWEPGRGGELVYRAGRREGPAADSLTLRLTPIRCADTMAGARFPFTAQVDRHGTTFHGCALEGRRAETPSSP